MKSKITKSELEARIQTLENAIGQYAGLAERVEKLEIGNTLDTMPSSPLSIPDDKIHAGHAIQDGDGYTFVRAEGEEFVELLTGQRFGYSQLAHPITRVQIGVTADGGGTWTEV